MDLLITQQTLLKCPTYVPCCKRCAFKNAWATPYCSSTRAGTVTGRYSFRTSVGTVIGAANSNDLDSAEMTIASLLKYDAPVNIRLRILANGI
ncbi:MAG: hypothetical protein IPH46_09165 [Bacteroidetes bacterium]|nr:hypothetical protein [Bacteroidota bacterium]